MIKVTLKFEDPDQKVEIKLPDDEEMRQYFLSSMEITSSGLLTRDWFDIWVNLTKTWPSCKVESVEYKEITGAFEVIMPTSGPMTIPEDPWPGDPHPPPPPFEPPPPPQPT